MIRIERSLLLFCLTMSAIVPAIANADQMPRVVVSKDNDGFVLEPSGRPFVPLGFNYDHDSRGRLLEHYWDAEWDKVETHFHQMKELGANVIRIHLQLDKFMQTADQPNEKSLNQLARLLQLAEKERLYLDLTGLGCYHKPDIPAWYDALSESDRWAVQARFWKAVAARCANSPAIFFYDLMNEPVVPSTKLEKGDWLEPPFADNYYTQRITLDPKDRPGSDVARQWVRTMVAAVREKDPKHLITVGMLDWSVNRPGVPQSGFDPNVIAAELDFIAVHIYPKSGQLKQDLETLSWFRIGKPVIIEEIYPLACSAKELEEFIQASKKHANGWIGFYWGQLPDELRKSGAVNDSIQIQWLELFDKIRKDLNH